MMINYVLMTFALVIFLGGFVYIALYITQDDEATQN